MRTRLREYFHQTEHLRVASKQRELIKMMSSALQHEVAWTCNQQWLQRVYFLKDAPLDFLVQVAPITGLILTLSHAPSIHTSLDPGSTLHTSLEPRSTLHTSLDPHSTLHTSLEPRTLRYSSPAPRLARLRVQVALKLEALVFAPSEVLPCGRLYIVNRGLAIYAGKLLGSGKVWGEQVCASFDCPSLTPQPRQCLRRHPAWHLCHAAACDATLA